MSHVYVVGKLRNSDSPVSNPEVDALTSRLAELHGDVFLSRESHGMHANMACPECLQREGTKELSSKHLAINLDRFLGQGGWRPRMGTYNRNLSARCMKNAIPYTVTELLKMRPLSERGFTGQAVGKVVSRSSFVKLVPDGNGNMVPQPAGIMIPVNQLPGDHPAVFYLRSRRHDLDQLVAQFRCSFCQQETPECFEEGIWYRRLPCGFKNTPQGRIIFHIDVDEVLDRRQACVMDYYDEASRIKYYWHPYKNQSLPCENKK